MDESAAALSAGGIGGFAMTFVFCMKKILPYPRRKVKFFPCRDSPNSPPRCQHNFAPNGASRSGTAKTTPPDSSSNPTSKNSDINGPTCFGGEMGAVSR